MTKDELVGWALSTYNENTDDQLDYYMNERQNEIGNTAYLYDHSTEEFAELIIVYIISRSDDPIYYDFLLKSKDVLVFKEDVFAEFVTDNDCYLMWFIYKQEDNK